MVEGLTHLPVVQVSLENDQVTSGEVNEEIGSLRGKTPKGETGTPEGVALVSMYENDYNVSFELLRLKSCVITHLNLPSCTYFFHRRPITLNMSMSSSLASGNKYP